MVGAVEAGQGGQVVLPLARVTVADLLDRVASRPSGTGPPARLAPGTCLADVDVQQRPVCLWVAHVSGMPYVVPRPMVLAPTTPLADALRRMLTRPAGHRHLPAVCTDASGRYVGLIHPDRLTLRLLESLDPDAARPPDLPRAGH